MDDTQPTQPARNWHLLCLFVGIIFLGNIGLTSFWWPELIGSNLTTNFSLPDGLINASIFIFFMGVVSILWGLLHERLFSEKAH